MPIHHYSHVYQSNVHFDIFLHNREFKHRGQILIVPIPSARRVSYLENLTILPSGGEILPSCDWDCSFLSQHPSIWFHDSEFLTIVFRQTNIWSKTFEPSIRNSMNVFGYNDYKAFCRNKTESRFEWTRRYICPLDWLLSSNCNNLLRIHSQSHRMANIGPKLFYILFNHLTGKLHWFYNRFYLSSWLFTYP